MMGGIERKTSRSKIDLQGMCGKRVMANSTMCRNADAEYTEDARKRSNR